MKKKMYMTQQVANNLMDDLAIMALQLEGGLIYNDDGSLCEEQKSRIEEYSRTRFIALTEEWEQANGSSIVVIPADEEDE